MLNGLWCGLWCVVCGVWCVVCGVWCVVCGVWCVVCGVWSVVCGVAAVVWLQLQILAGVGLEDALEGNTLGRAPADQTCTCIMESWQQFHFILNSHQAWPLPPPFHKAGTCPHLCLCIPLAWPPQECPRHTAPR
jgi:hypothetical protein